MIPVYEININNCSTCHKVESYSVPMDGYPIVAARLNFRNLEAVAKRGIENISVIVREELTSEEIQTTPEIENQDGIVTLKFKLCELKRKNIVRVFLSLPNKNTAQTKINQSFGLRKK